MTAEGALEIDANTDNRDPIRVNLENWGDEERKELEDRLKSAFSSPWFVKQGDF
jgi:hypothetical protein